MSDNQNADLYVTPDRDNNVTCDLLKMWLNLEEMF